MLKHHYLKNQKHSLKFLLHFCNLQKILRISKKKDQLHSLSISESIKSEKYGYLHAWKLVF